MPLLILLFAIGLQIFFTSKKLSPFLSLLVVAIVAGLLLGMSPGNLIRSIETGVGNTLGGSGLALIICLGAVLGKILEATGAIEKIASHLIAGFGERYVQWALLLTGFLVGIPLYYNAGFIILVPLIFTLARKTGLPLLYIAIPTAASLSTTHCFLPPHPGPVTLVAKLNADMGKVLLYGLLMAIPAVIIAGPLLGRRLQKIKADVSGFFLAEEKPSGKKLPAAFASFFIALLPVVLITLSVIASYFLSDSLLKTILLFIGNATIALLISVLLAIYYFGIRRGTSMQMTMQWMTDAISGIAIILLIITAGGVFSQVLRESGTAGYISSFSSKLDMPPLVFAWLITALLRVSIGSATVSGITAAGIVAPLLTNGVSPELMVLSVGAGSVFGSHINDSGFWMFKEFFGLSLKQTFLSWTVMETIISFIGLVGVLVLDVFV